MTDQVRQFVVSNYLFGRENGLSDSDSFLESGIIDSTGILELIGFIEKTFAIRVENDELIPENLDSIEKVAAYVRSKLNGRG